MAIITSLDLLSHWHHSKIPFFGKKILTSVVICRVYSHTAKRKKNAHQAYSQIYHMDPQQNISGQNWINILWDILHLVYGVYYTTLGYLANRIWNEICPFSDSKFHGANMGPTWVLTAPDGPHAGIMNLANRVVRQMMAIRTVMPLKCCDNKVPWTHAFCMTWFVASMLWLSSNTAFE